MNWVIYFDADIGWNETHPHDCIIILQSDPMKKIFPAEMRKSAYFTYWLHIFIKNIGNISQSSRKIIIVYNKNMKYVSIDV